MLYHPSVERHLGYRVRHNWSDVAQYNDKKEWNFAIFSNMDGLGGHYVKLNKLEIQIL